MLAGDRLELGEQRSRQARAAVGRGHVHALDLGDVGVEVADAAEPGRLAVDPGEQQHAVWRR